MGRVKGHGLLIGKIFTQKWVVRGPKVGQDSVMATVGEIVARARNNAGMSQDALSARSGMSKTAIQNIETGRSQKPHAGTLISLARALGFDTWGDVVASVASHNGTPRNKMIPILADIPASFGDGCEVQDAYNHEEAEGWLSYAAVPNVQDPKAFALRVRGDSMMPRYHEGELVICSPECFERHGFIDGKRYAIRFRGDQDGETTLKRVRIIDDNTLELIPENDRHPTRRVAQSAIACAARVVARVVEEE